MKLLKVFLGKVRRCQASLMLPAFCVLCNLQFPISLTNCHGQL